MAKIGVIEDNVEDVVVRYRYLAQTNHEVHLILDTCRMVMDNWLEGFLTENGFNLDRTYYGLDSLDRKPDLMNLDLYFCDGLRGQCFDIVKKLGAEKTYILTAHEGIEAKARAQGLRTLGEGEHLTLIRLLKE